MFTLAKQYTNQDPTGWWMSEKLDGVRACWNKDHFVSRLGNRIVHPPELFTHLPKLKLDGELWINRGKFQQTVSTVKKKVPLYAEWQRISFKVFDWMMPDLPYYTRYDMLNTTTLDVVGQTACPGKEPLANFLAEIVEQGGEGIMLRNPNSEYEPFRTGNLLKVKPNYFSEGVLIGTTPGEGKYTGVVGAYILEWKRQTITVGSGLTDHERSNPKPIGSVIKFKYLNLTNGGMPRCPILL